MTSEKHRARTVLSGTPSWAECRTSSSASCTLRVSVTRSEHACRVESERTATAISSTHLDRRFPPRAGREFSFTSCKVSGYRVSRGACSSPRLLVFSSPRLLVSSPPRLLVSPPSRLLVSSSPRLLVSSSPRLLVSSSHRLLVSSSPRLPLKANHRQH
jgi:hypothetical protein